MKTKHSKTKSFSLLELSGNCVLFCRPSEGSFGVIFGCPQGCFLSICRKRTLYFFYRIDLIFTLRIPKSCHIFLSDISKTHLSHWSPVAKILSHILALFYFYSLEMPPLWSLFLSSVCVKAISLVPSLHLLKMS